MGQSATLYRIDKNDISKIDGNPKKVNLFELTKGYESYSKSFDGLIFVLSKNLNQPNIELIQQIFYPKTFFGERPDFSNIDFDNLPDNFDFELDTLPYNAPNIVSEVSSLLESIKICLLLKRTIFGGAYISTTNFCENFNHIELNKNNVYPGDIWNDKKEENAAFNVRHMSSEFEKIKAFYKEVKEAEDYLLIYIG